MRFQPARKAADIVNENDMRRGPAVFFKERQHGQHARPIDHPARCAFVTKDFNDFVALGVCIIAAARFLRAEPVALLHLRKTGYAGINNGFGSGGWQGHSGRRLSFCDWVPLTLALRGSRAASGRRIIRIGSTGIFYTIQWLDARKR